MKDFDLCAVGHAIVDVLVRVEDQDLRKLTLKKGSRTHVDPGFQSAVSDYLQGRTQQFVCGGSAANTVVLFAQLGGKAAFVSSLGDDFLGARFEADMQRWGIYTKCAVDPSKETGTCIVLITPDGARTMLTHLGASTSISRTHLDHELLERCRWIFLEAYALCDSNEECIIFHAAAAAKQHGCRVAFSLSDRHVVQKQKAKALQLADLADLVIGNEEEACAVSAASNFQEALDVLQQHCPMSVVTLAEQGAALTIEGQRVLVPPAPCQAVDSTGAGDVFAGAFLYGLTQNYTPKQSADGAARLASEVLKRVGGRLDPSAKEIWRAAVEES